MNACLATSECILAVSESYCPLLALSLKVKVLMHSNQKHGTKQLIYLAARFKHALYSIVANIKTGIVFKLAENPFLLELYFSNYVPSL